MNIPSSTVDLYSRAVRLWGKDSQHDMFLEEAAELIKAILKYRRDERAGKPVISLTAVQEEIADVRIMLEQIDLLFCGSDDFYELKLKRLKRRIEGCERMEKTPGEHPYYGLFMFVDGSGPLLHTDIGGFDEMASLASEYPSLTLCRCDESGKYVEPHRFLQYSHAQRGLVFEAGGLPEAGYNFLQWSTDHPDTREFELVDGPLPHTYVIKLKK